MVKAGDIVHYEVNGNKKLALVLFSHVGNRNHLGANGEPLLHLAFLAPERESERVRSNPGYIPEIFIEYDVHHISHEFSEEYKREHHAFTPAQIASRRGTSGMWQEAAVLLADDHAELLSVKDVSEVNLNRADAAESALDAERKAHAETKEELEAERSLDMLKKPEQDKPAEESSDFVPGEI